MKKLLPAIALVAISFAATAQTTTTTISTTTGSIDVNRLRFGAYVAPNISYMKPTSTKDDKSEFATESNGSKVGFSYGLMAEYFFAQNYGFVTGLQVNGTGGKVLATSIVNPKQNNSIQKADFEYKLQYLEIPLALKLRTDDINGFKFFGQLGVTVGFNIGKKVNFDVDYLDTNGDLKSYSDENIKLKGGFGVVAPVLFTMNIGAGMEYPISNKLSAYLGFFFNNGFAPDATNPEKIDAPYLYPGATQAKFQDGNTRLNSFSLRVGLFF